MSDQDPRTDEESSANSQPASEAGGSPSTETEDPPPADDAGTPSDDGGPGATDGEDGAPTRDGDGAPAGSEDGHSDASADDPPTTRRAEETVLFESTPTIKPTLLVAFFTLLAGLAAEGYLLTNPEAAGGQETTEILVYVIAFVLVVALLRFLIRMLVLERTTYQITDEVVRREYELLYRQLSREVPIERLRAHELRKNRVQAALGYGTVRFLTGGTNESLGFIEFENLIEPYEVQDVIRELIQ